MNEGLKPSLALKEDFWLSKHLLDMLLLFCRLWPYSRTFEYLSQKKQIKVCHLHVLLHSNVKHVDLSVCSSLINDQIISAVGFRCKVCIV